MNHWPGQQPNMFSTNPPNHLNQQSMYANPAQFDLNNSPFTQGLQNGNSGTPTPAFTNSVIPAKRPHDGGMSGSPQQSGHNSTAQNPNFNNGFPNQQSGGQQYSNAPTPYAHLQQPGSVNGTPSPTMQNQPFRPPGQPQRMQNSSPSPFPQQQQQQSGQPHANFGGQMSPGPPQSSGQQTNMSQQGQMPGWNQGMGMSGGMSMPGMPNAMPPQMGNMQGQNMPNNAQLYQMKLLQQQQQMRNSGMMGPRPVGAKPNQMPNFSGQQPGAQMQNGQGQNPMAANAAQQQQQHQQKRAALLKSIATNAQQQGRPFNPTPTISGRPVDLYALWNLLSKSGGSQTIERMGQWPAVAMRLGFPQQQFPNAGEEMKQIHAVNMSAYERLYLAMQVQAKQEQARVNAQQMAGVAAPSQASPTKMMQPSNQQNQFPFQQGQKGPPQSQATPVQAHAQLPQNGMTTPQQQQMMQHRRNSSVRKPEQMTPQPMGPGMTAPSPHSVPRVQRSPSIKQESGPAPPVMKSEEPQSTNYAPQVHSVQTDGGYNIGALYELGNVISRVIPNMPSVDEMGVIDTRAIMLSLASGIHGEVRYALDMLAITSCDQRISFDLDKCDDMLDVIIDCAEDQIDALSEDSAEVSDGIDLPSYEDIMRGSRVEVDTLRDVPAFGAPGYDLERAAERVVAITTILRNFSFYECNHRLLTSTPLIKWLSNTIRLMGTRNMLLRSFINTQDFYKDMVIFLSNITQSLTLPSRDDALHILHFLLAFTPQPTPSFTEKGKNFRFASFIPIVHRYLPPAVDCLAKLLARQDPNRMLYRSIFTTSNSSLATSEAPLDLLTRAFALAISVLPDRSKGALGNNAQLRIVEARKAYLSQGMLAADILTTLAPSNNAELARTWIESEDGWAVGLLNLAALLSVDRTPPNQGPKAPNQGVDTESFRLITHRALTMMKRLAEKAGQGRSFANGGPVRSTSNSGTADGALDAADASSVGAPKWEGIPQGHAILGALMMPNTDKVALGLLCGLHEMAMQTSVER